jgi:putative membrane protein insertion efficiency factor
MIAHMMRWMIKGYQNLISPLLPPMCRFHPSCSQYAVEALEVHGGLSGAVLAGSRILRCNPLFAGGMDPVPARRGALGAD